MKKLNLAKLKLESEEILTREQLKNVLGGASIPLSGAGDCQEYGQSCNTAERKNCCNGCHCSDNKCRIATVAALTDKCSQ